MVCPNLYPVEFTCVGIEVNSLEWERSQIVLAFISSRNANEGMVPTQNGPFTVFLDAITRNDDGANMTSRLVGNISDLISGDTIKCAGFNVEDIVTLDFTLRGKEVIYSACSQILPLSLII